MTPLRRLLRNLWERWKGRYYDGPEPPERLTQLVLAFATTYPRATRGEWIEFAVGLARECYRSGYTRGNEWAERDLERRDPVQDPEVLAELEGHDWTWFESDETPEPSGLDDVVPEDPPPEPDRIQRHVREYFYAGDDEPKAR